MFEFGIIDIIDILCVALMLYYIYRLMKESQSINVFTGVIVFILCWLFVSQILEMKLLGSIMDKLVSVGVIAMIILFQAEIRKFLYSLGAHRQMAGLMRFFSPGNKREHKADRASIMPIVMACMNMGRGKVGALIVISTTQQMAETGLAHRRPVTRRHIQPTIRRAVSGMLALQSETLYRHYSHMTGAWRLPASSPRPRWSTP